ncbi:MAG: cysteine desulfurase [Deltaproteobacteria bacterium]|nr:cysteine desulfurase [Deltaproteobacteria bacterium]
MSDPIYLDHNATTPVEPRVLEQMLPYFVERFGNPSSGHPVGWDAAAAIADARSQVAGLLGCQPDEIVFTSGGTEANNAAIRGVASHRSTPAKIVTTAVEHPATVEPCRLLESRGWTVARVDVDQDGLVDSGRLIELLDDDTVLVTVMHANNETGALMPVAEIAGACRERGIPLHTDAAQSAGKVPVLVKELGVDLLSIAGHKLYAPKGIGALFVHDGVELEPVLRGAGQERGIKPGTENVAGIVALGAACELARTEMSEEERRIRGMRDELHRRLDEAIPGLRLVGPVEQRLPNTLNVLFPGVRGSLLLARCDEVAASTGAACHEGGDETPSVVLSAMGIDPEEALGAVRLTLGRLNQAPQIAIAADALVRAYHGLTGG